MFIYVIVSSYIIYDEACINMPFVLKLDMCKLTG